jgi:hypothetical protein
MLWESGRIMDKELFTNIKEGLIAVGEIEKKVINRIEVIDNLTGRLFVKHLPINHSVEISMQDNGKTMKIFLSPDSMADRAKIK